MKFNLIRNLETKRNKEQEDSFSETMNPELYFDINKKIEKIDGWKFSNVKKLVNFSKKANSIIIDLEFSKWNSNIEYIYNNSNVNIQNFISKNTKLKEAFFKKDIDYIHNYLKQISENKNLKLEFLFYVADEIKKDSNSLILINEFINNSILNLDASIDVSITLLLKNWGVNGK